MKQILNLTKEQFDRVTDKIENCQIARIDREHELEETLGPEKYDEDRYDTDRMLNLWLNIEGDLESFLEKSGYEYNFYTGKFYYNIIEVSAN